MENQHQKIKGYRDLSQEEIDLMNEIKAKGAELSVLLTKVNLYAVPAFQGSDPQRWLAIAKTDFQTGIMALTRAVAQPETF